MEVNYYYSGALDCLSTSQNLQEKGGFIQAREIFLKIFRVFSVDFISSPIFDSPFLGKYIHFGSVNSSSINHNFNFSYSIIHPHVIGSILPILLNNIRLDHESTKN